MTANQRPPVAPQRALQFELPLFAREEPPVALAPDVAVPNIAPMPPAAPTIASPLTPSTSGPVHPGERRRSIALDQQPLEYALKRSRRRSIGFAIDEQGLTVTAPKWVTLAQVEEAIREKQRWIFSKIVELRERRQGVPTVAWEDGGVLPYLGAPITLRIAHGAAARGEAIVLDAEAAILHVALPPAASTQQLKDRVQGWMQATARQLFTERLEIYGARLGVKHRILRLSSASTRWGSCSADGKILLNWRLVHFPLSSIDYVVAHELAHLKEMNHGPRFWQTVADLLPGFESARAHLKNPPPELLPKF